MFHILIGLLWFIFIGAWLVHSFETKKTQKTQSKAKYPIFRFVLVIVLMTLAFNLEAVRPWMQYQFFPDNPYVQILGVLICAAGIMLAVDARNHLGKNWGLPMDERENSDLVTTGPYQFVRHPIYSGIVLATIGSILTSGFLWVVWLIIIVPYFIYSALKEEKRMLKQFPGVYPDYMKRTKMFILFLI